MVAKWEKRCVGVVGRSGGEVGGVVVKWEKSGGEVGEEGWWRSGSGGEVGEGVYAEWVVDGVRKVE